MRNALILTWLTVQLAGAAEQPLTLQQARQIALQNQPRVAAADLKAEAAQQRLVQARSAFFPTVTANATAVGTADPNTRIAAGGLSNSGIFDRNAEGIIINQLITDFGRTADLTDSARLRTRAERTNALLMRAQVLLLVDTAYYSVLQAGAVRRIASETVKTRQLLLDRVSALASNKLRSDLDVSFARVALGEGQLLQNKSENDYRAAYTSLLTTLGVTNAMAFQLVDETAPSDVNLSQSELVGEALGKRLELVSLRLEREAATKLARAEKALHYPTISAVAAGGFIPVHDNRLRSDYGAAGVNFSLPLFAGFLPTARQREAELNAQRAGELLRDEENLIIRDVQIAYQNVGYSQAQVKLAASLAENAHQALTLAESRYQIGSSSIVELSQAQLNATAAEITLETARFDHRLQLARLQYQLGRNNDAK